MAASASADRPLSAAAGALAAFAERAFAAADACSAHPAATLHLAHGTSTTRVRVAGTALAGKLTPSLRPFAAAAAAHDIDLLALDTAAAGTPPPPPPWPPDAYRPRDELAGFGTEQLEVAYALLPGTLHLWDEGRARGLYWTRDAASQPSWDIAAPLRTLLRWGLRGRGLAVVHGAVVGDDRGGLLLVGASGSGKSTTALAAALAGMRYVGDDYCAVALGPPFVAHGLYANGKAGEATMRLLPGLRALTGDLPVTDEGKHVLDLSTTGALTPRLPLRAIVLPRVAAATGTPVAATPGAALAALAPTSLVQLPGSRPADGAAMARLAAGLPARHLDVGPDPEAVVAALGAILAEVSGA